MGEGQGEGVLSVINKNTMNKSGTQKTGNLQLWSWVLYDISGGVFSLLIVTLIYAVYFKEVVFNSSPLGDFAWGASVSVSIVIVALTSPVFGALADYSGLKKRFLGITTFSCMFFTSMLYFVGRGDTIKGVSLFILANVFNASSLTFYNAFLIDISKRDNVGRVSGIGWAVGYAGAIVILLSLYPLLKAGFSENNLHNIRYSFILVALSYLFFSIPLFAFLKEEKVFRSKQDKSYIKIGFLRVYETLLELKNYRNLPVFLLAYFFYNDGITTVIVFSSIYASSTLKFAMNDLIIFFLSIQVTAMAGSFIFGCLVDRIGAKRVIIITLVIWCAVVAGVYLVEKRTVFYIIGLVAGFAMGSCQSASRSLMAKFTPEERSAEFFGFYSFCSKVSAILGPVVFGAISSLTGNQRMGVLSVLIFFIIGLVLMRKVEEPLYKNSKS